MKADEKQVGGSHYKSMAMQPWQVVDAAPFAEQIGYHRFTAIAYLMRAGAKGSAAEDCRKAAHVCEKLAEVFDAQVQSMRASATDHADATHNQFGMLPTCFGNRFGVSADAAPVCDMCHVKDSCLTELIARTRDA